MVFFREDQNEAFSLLLFLDQSQITHCVRIYTNAVTKFLQIYVGWMFQNTCRCAGSLSQGNRAKRV